MVLPQGTYQEHDRGSQVKTHDLIALGHLYGGLILPLLRLPPGPRVRRPASPGTVPVRVEGGRDAPHVEGSDRNHRHPDRVRFHQDNEALVSREEVRDGLNRVDVHGKEPSRDRPGPDDPPSNGGVDTVVVARAEIQGHIPTGPEARPVLLAPQQVCRGVGDSLGLERRLVLQQSTGADPAVHRASGKEIVGRPRPQARAQLPDEEGRERRKVGRRPGAFGQVDSGRPCEGPVHPSAQETGKPDLRETTRHPGKPGLGKDPKQSEDQAPPERNPRRRHERFTLKAGCRTPLRSTP